MNPDEDILAPGYNQTWYLYIITPNFPVICANIVIILLVLQLDFCHLPWKISVPTQSYHDNDTNDETSSQKITLDSSVKKSAQNKFILKQSNSNCLTGSKVCMEDSKEINYAEIRKQMPGAWPAPSLK